MPNEYQESKLARAEVERLAKEDKAFAAQLLERVLDETTHTSRLVTTSAVFSNGAGLIGVVTILAKAADN